MNASVLDFRTRMGDIMRAINRRERVTLTYRGKVKAALVPVNESSDAGKVRPVKVADTEAFGMWKDRDEMSDATQYVKTLRKGRSFK